MLLVPATFLESQSMLACLPAGDSKAADDFFPSLEDSLVLSKLFCSLPVLFFFCIVLSSRNFAAAAVVVAPPLYVLMIH